MYTEREREMVVVDCVIRKNKLKSQVTCINTAEKVLKNVNYCTIIIFCIISITISWRGLLCGAHMNHKEYNVFMCLLYVDRKIDK